jgi:protein required for attachment to host cells
MLNKFTNPTPLANKTWILVANRSHAYVLESDGGLKNLQTVEHFEFPQGRLRNQDIDADRSSGAVSTAGGAYPVHGLGNKGEAHEHMAQTFAHQLAHQLGTARTENKFERLVLVAEDHFLGELLVCLDEATTMCVVSSIHKDIAGLHMPRLIEQLGQIGSFKLTG